VGPGKGGMRFSCREERAVCTRKKRQNHSVKKERRKPLSGWGGEKGDILGELKEELSKK